MSDLSSYPGSGNVRPWTFSVRAFARHRIRSPDENLLESQFAAIPDAGSARTTIPVLIDLRLSHYRVNKCVP